MRYSYSFGSFLAAVTLGAALFITSDHVQRTEKTLDALQEKIRIERDSLRVLKAEWTYLNRPDRLEQLAASHLPLAAATAQQLSNTTAVIQAAPKMDEESGGQIIPAAYTKQKPVQKMMRPATPVTTPSFNQLVDRLTAPEGSKE